MVLRSAIFSVLCLGLTTASHAAFVKGVLTGEVTSLFGTNLAGEYDADAFASILPFGVGSIVHTEFTYDTDDYQPQITHNVTGTVRLSIDGTVFFEQATALNVTPEDAVVDNRTRFILSPRSPFFEGLETLFPSGWQVEQTLAEGGGSFAFRAVGLFGDTEFPAQGFNLPVGPWDESDFTSADFWIMTSVTEGGSSTWTVPGGGSFTGLQQSISGRYTSFTVTVVPEPSAIAILATGLIGLAWRLRRPH